MNVVKEQTSDSQVKLTITVNSEEMKPHMERAAKKLSLKNPIKGFRPGKASYEIIARHFGEMTILQEAMNPILDHTLIDALKKENLDFVGSPQIEIQKMAPGNDLVYLANCDLMPKANVPTDWKTLQIKKEKGVVTEEKVQSIIDDLAISKSKQVLKDDVASTGDKIFIDFELSFENVIPEGGTAKNFEVLIGSNKMIPGFENQLIGLKKDDEKTFVMEFPSDYFRKEFAGKTGTFKIKILHIFSMEKPELNDAFAENFGHKTFNELTNIIRENIQSDLDRKNEQGAELQMFETLIEKTEFQTIPESMIMQEKETMITEMKNNAEKQGLDFNDYLTHIKKTIDELKNDFNDDAIKRVKSGLILKTIRERENITVSDEEVNETLEQAHKHAHEQNEKHDHEMYAKNPRYREFIRNTLAIQKITKLMKSHIIVE